MDLGDRILCCKGLCIERFTSRDAVAQCASFVVDLQRLNPPLLENRLDFYVLKRPLNKVPTVQMDFIHWTLGYRGLCNEHVTKSRSRDTFLMEKGPTERHFLSFYNL